MYKLGHEVEGDWREYSHPPLFSVERTNDGRDKILAAAPGGDPLVFTSLVDLLTPPFFLLYILHTPRGEGRAGRYQSGEMDRGEVRTFLDRFADLLRTDARFDLWVHAAADRATVIWDRHDLIHAYGPIDLFTTALHGLGLARGVVTIPAPHEHHYHAANDEQAQALLDSIDWRYSPLQPEDEQ